LLIVSTPLFSQQDSALSLFSFGYTETHLDSTLNDSIYYLFDDFDKSIPLKSIAFDLNEDGNKEKFIPNDCLCGTGGCPWIIYDVNKQKLLGKISGGVIYINQKKINGYHEIETYLRNGADGGSVMVYEYTNGKFVLKKSAILNNKESQIYFQKK